MSVNSTGTGIFVIKYEYLSLQVLDGNQDYDSFLSLYKVNFNN